MNRISSPPPPAPVSSLSRDNWRSIPVKGQSTDPSQKVGASIAYSVEPAWYVFVEGAASRGGKATVELNRETFQVNIAPLQLAGVTASLLQKAFAARGYQVQVSGNEKPTAAELAVLKAQLAQKERLQRSGRLTEEALYRLNIEIEILKSQIENQGRFFMEVVAPK